MTRLASVLALLAVATFAAADAFAMPGFYQPTVPVSAFARPAPWLDPSRLHMSTELSFGSGMGSGPAGLQVTRLSYQLGTPLAVQVSLGNAFGSSRGGNGNGFFLEGLDLAYRPLPSMMFQVHFQDLRSPLQRQNPYDSWYGP